MDNYEAVRSIPFPVLAAALGADLTKFKTRKGGQEHFGPCPVHKPKLNQTSFSYHSSGAFQCFSCSAKGKGALDLVKLARGVNFTGAVAFLEPLVSKESANEKTPATGVVEASGELKPYTGKYEKFKVPCAWLEKRIPDAAIRERYGVFCYDNQARKSAYSGRVMLPVKDPQGVLYGYLGRSIEPATAPKYLFPKNLPKSQFLFGAAELKAGIFGQLPLRVCYLVESPFSVLRFASLNLPAVSPFGWSVSEEQVQLLCTLAKGIVYLCDRNKYDMCAETLLRISRRLWTKAPSLPAGIGDPEHLSREQILALSNSGLASVT